MTGTRPGPNDDDGFNVEAFRESINKTDLSEYLKLSVAAGRELFDDLDEMAMQLSLKLMQTTEMVNYDLESTVLRPTGFSTASFHLAFVISLAESVESGRLPAITGMSRATVSVVVKTLVGKGIVRSERSERDGRSKTLTITEEGKRMVNTAWRQVNIRERLWASRLEPEEQVEMLRLLTKLAAGAKFGAKLRY